MKKLMLIVVLVTGIVTATQAQKFTKAPDDKSVVYFVRSSSMGFAINFKYFDNDKIIGKFSGKGYIMYECEPGQHIFWAASENADFIIADIEPGKTYMVEVAPKMGGIKARVKLYPISPDDKKAIKNAWKVVEKKSPEEFSDEKTTEFNTEYPDYIQPKLDKFSEKKQENYQFEHITNAMALPSELLIVDFVE